MKEYGKLFIVFVLVITTYLSTSFIVDWVNNKTTEITKSEQSTVLYDDSKIRLDDIDIKLDLGGVIGSINALLLGIGGLIIGFKTKKHEIKIKDDVNVTVKLGKRRK